MNKNAAESSLSSTGSPDNALSVVAAEFSFRPHEMVAKRDLVHET